MIYEKIGNILEQIDAPYICHQVNCKGVMGAGLARQIKPLLTQEQFGQYRTVCAKYGAGCLGKIQLFPLQDKSKRTIVNIFGENIPTEHQCDTDYVALKNGLLAITRIAYQEKKAVAIPGMIGCGLAGGDWQFVYKSILLPIFENRLVDLFIFWLNEDLNEKGNELIRYTDPHPIIF